MSSPQAPKPASRGRGERASLTRARVIQAALELADEEGIGALTMRRLGGRLGVEAMSLYNHVADKDDILDELVELVVSGFEVPTGEPDWKTSIRDAARSAHRVLRRHPWASSVIESRTRTGPVRLALVEATVGVLRGAGFPMPVVLRTLMALDSHTYGYTLQEQAWPYPEEQAPERAAAFAVQLPDGAYPNMAELVAYVEGSGGGPIVDFEFGLDLMLDGLERMLPGR